MIVTILRHGEAGSARVDAERELTPQGIDDISFAGQQFHSACVDRGLPTPGIILHSRWLRATETADIFARSCPNCLVETEQALQPDGDVVGVTDMLNKLQDDPLGERRGEPSSGRVDRAHVVLVSHQPLVSELADYYLGPANPVPGLCPGGLFTINMDVPASNAAILLFWAVPPEYQAGI
jgi:phosphohistidine phosphatase